MRVRGQARLGRRGAGKPQLTLAGMNVMLRLRTAAAISARDACGAPATPLPRAFCVTRATRSSPV